MCFEKWVARSFSLGDPTKTTVVLVHSVVMVSIQYSFFQRFASGILNPTPGCTIQYGFFMIGGLAGNEIGGWVMFWFVK